MDSVVIGFGGASASGLFHAQRLGLRPEVRCVLTSTMKSSSGQVNDGRDQSRICTDELLSDSQIRVVWMDQQVDLGSISAAVEAEKHVVCELPIQGATEDWRRLCEFAGKGGVSRLLFAALHRWEGRGSTVRKLIESGTVGTVTDLRRISRQYIPAELGFERDLIAGSSSTSNQGGLLASNFSQVKWFEMLDELLLLEQSPVLSVSAKDAHDGRAVWVTFASGCRAYVEFHRRSLAPLETGWVIEGTAGGYADGRHFRAAADFELIDVPVEELPSDQDAFYNSLLATVCHGAPFPVTNESILRVLELRDAIEMSVRTGQTVSIESKPQVL